MSLMKFTAVFKDGVLCERTFHSKSVEEAKFYCFSHLSNYKNIFLINHSEPLFPIHLGDARVTSAFERAYNRIKFDEKNSENYVKL